jgi:hypothetical protein
LVLLAAGSSYALAQQVTTKKSTTAAISFVGAPIILTGAFYYPGYDYLPGTSLALAACALSARRRVTMSGVCIGLLVFTKLIMAPLALSAVACIFYASNRMFQSYKLILAAGMIVVVIICVLFARSEFWPYIEITLENVEHSQSPFFINSSSMWTLVASHVKRISSPLLSTLLFSFFLSLFIAIILLPRQNYKRRRIIVLIITSLVTITIALVVLMLTGLWEIHDQILYFPSVLIAICLTAVIESAYSSARPILMLCFITSLAFLLGGGPELRRYLHRPEGIIVSAKMLNAATPVAVRLLALGPTGAYARLGSNDDYGSPLGLTRWKLICPRFHQWPFQSSEALGKVLKCASAAPNLIVAKSIAHLDGNPAWNQFVDNVEDLLRSSYKCDTESGLRICTRLGTPFP